jgi:hypothetical protein
MCVCVCEANEGVHASICVAMHVAQLAVTRLRWFDDLSTLLFGCNMGGRYVCLCLRCPVCMSVSFVCYGVCVWPVWSGRMYYAMRDCVCVRMRMCLCPSGCLYVQTCGRVNVRSKRKELMRQYNCVVSVGSRLPLLIFTSILLFGCNTDVSASCVWCFVCLCSVCMCVGGSIERGETDGVVLNVCVVCYVFARVTWWDDVSFAIGCCSERAPKVLKEKQAGLQCRKQEVVAAFGVHPLKLQRGRRSGENEMNPRRVCICAQSDLQTMSLQSKRDGDQRHTLLKK